MSAHFVLTVALLLTDPAGMGLVQAKAGGGVALGVEVADQNLGSLRGERGGQVDAGRGFAHASFLVDDGDGLAH